MSILRRKRDREAVDPEARSEQSGLKYKDLAVLGQLMKAGADLAQPRHVVHYLYFPIRPRAEEAAEEARGCGFSCEVREPLPAYPDQWSMVAERHGVVLDQATVRESGDFFDSLAGRYRGEYDGWEASV